MGVAVQELHDKASRAWFGISNIVAKNKRMEVEKIFNIFDSLVTPVALYGCEFWLPLIIPKKSLSQKNNLLTFWKDLLCEKINQKCARLSLSVNNKTSRLAVLGELGRYPLYIKALSQCLNYNMSLLGPDRHNSLLSDTLIEMQCMSLRGTDCWLARVEKMQKLLSIPDRPFFKKTNGKKCTDSLKSRFDRFWLDSINMTGKTQNDTTDQSDHNKLRTYRRFKASFTREPYIDLVRNRNQKSFLSRLRTGSHHLNIEKGRWTRPVTPVEQRTCQYCTPSTVRSSPRSGQSPSASAAIDNEQHFLMSCSRFSDMRKSAFEEINFISPQFLSLSENQQFYTLLCPTEAKTAKITNRLIKQMFLDRGKIDQLNGNEDNASYQ